MTTVRLQVAEKRCEGKAINYQLSREKSIFDLSTRNQISNTFYLMQLDFINSTAGS